MSADSNCRLIYFNLTGCSSCGSPPQVSHATAEVSNRHMSTGGSLQIATYTCDSRNGYATRGNNTIACLQMHGYTVWSSAQVSCHSKYNIAKIVI